MGISLRIKLAAALVVALVIGAISSGCKCYEPPGQYEIPRETAKVNLPPYVIEPPDILLIGAQRLVPLPPYHLEPLDSVLVTFPADPAQIPDDVLKALGQLGRAFSLEFVIEPEGTINLPGGIGLVKLADMTIGEAKAVVETAITRVVDKKYVTTGKVAVELSRIRGMQQVTGEHLVRPDGTVGLGTYGSVNVTGLTLEQARARIEEQLSKFLLNPRVSVDVAGYNSKVYYVLFDGAGNGEQVVRLPVTGNETVLDAVAQLGGLPIVADRHRIWIARPSHGEDTCDTIIDVDWVAISKCGSSAKNYQIFPGDRVYVESVPLLTWTTWLDRVVAPVERIMGVTILGVGTVHAFRNNNGNGNGNGNGGGF
jgi:polysaccharide export outer membrane protein